VRRCTAIPREMLPFGQDGLRDGLKTRGGIESRKAWPNLLFSDEALRPGGGLQGPAGRCWGVPAQGHQALRRAHGRPSPKVPFSPWFLPPQL
jgi:hypothetical protein